MIFSCFDFLLSFSMIYLGIFVFRKFLEQIFFPLIFVSFLLPSFDLFDCRFHCPGTDERSVYWLSTSAIEQSNNKSAYRFWSKSMNSKKDELLRFEMASDFTVTNMKLQTKDRNKCRKKCSRLWFTSQFSTFSVEATADGKNETDNRLVSIYAIRNRFCATNACENGQAATLAIADAGRIEVDHM